MGDWRFCATGSAAQTRGAGRRAPLGEPRPARLTGPRDPPSRCPQNPPATPWSAHLRGTALVCAQHRSCLAAAAAAAAAAGCEGT